MAGLEYAMLAALVAMLLAAAAGRLGGQAVATYQRMLATYSVAHAAPSLPLPAQRLDTAAH